MGEKAFNGNTCSIIELIPKTKSNFVKMVLYIKNSSKEIAGGDMYEKGGNVISLSITGLVSNPSDVNSNTFVFDPKKYPGVEIIDLR